VKFQQLPEPTGLPWTEEMVLMVSDCYQTILYAVKAPEPAYHQQLLRRRATKPLQRRTPVTAAQHVNSAIPLDAAYELHPSNSLLLSWQTAQQATADTTLPN